MLVKDILQRYGHTRAVAFYNSTDKAADISIDFDEIDLGGDVAVRDLYRHNDLGTKREKLTMRVPAHGTRIYKLTADVRYERNRYEGECGYLGAYQEIFNNQVKETAIYDGNSAASGGMVAGWLGQRADNDIQWRNVYSESGGEYELTVSFIAGESRSMTLEVNGSLTQNFDDCYSNAWNKVATLSQRIQLKPGDNIIRLYNAAAWMPDIDCISLRKLGADDRIPLGIRPIANAGSACTTADCCYNVKGQRMDANAAGISIQQGRKVLRPEAGC